MGKDLLRLDGEHPALVHLAPALVGASASRRGTARTARSSSPRPKTSGRRGARALHRNGRSRSTAAPRHRRRSASAGLHDAARATRTCSTPGSRRRCGRSRRSAGRTRPPELQTLLPDQRARHRLRHHLLLGRADDDDGAALHERGAVPTRLHPRAGARRARRRRCRSRKAT